jgi:small conductance mechanosensitive channel
MVYGRLRVQSPLFLSGESSLTWVIQLLGKMMRRSGIDDIIINYVSSITKAILLLLVFIAALNQLGVDTTSLIALIGAAGLAVGLALQNSLQNFAAGVMMIVFRPFKLGDFIEAGGVVGIVEQISIFSTVLKTGDNREIIVPNGQIYSDAITNYSARETRRVDMGFGIGYDDDMLAAKKVMASILEAHDLVLTEPAPVVAVTELEDSSVNFNVRPWVKTEDYWAVRSDLIEQIKLAFDEQNISIPYPHLSVVREGLES